MFISSSEPRESLFVPSIKSQTLLGKAVLEHFRNDKQIASVFSSSPSLRNSSAGANFLTNVNINEETVKLFERIFTPEDCFSLSFSPALSINSMNREETVWRNIFSFLMNFLKNQKYLEASLRSLQIRSEFINDEELDFIFSHLKRITKFKYVNYRNIAMSSMGFNIIPEILPNLEEFAVHFYPDLSDALNHFPKLSNLRKLELVDCGIIRDEDVRAICNMKSLTSLSFRESSGISSEALKHLLQLDNLTELNLMSSNVRDDTLEQISSHLVLLRSLNLSDSGNLTAAGLKKVCEMKQLEILNLNWIELASETFDHLIALENLTELSLIATSITDDDVGKICNSLKKLKLLDTACGSQLTRSSLEHMKKLPFLQIVNVGGYRVVSVDEIHSFVLFKKSSLKKISSFGATLFEYCTNASQILSNPSSWSLHFSSAQSLAEKEFSFLIELVGDENRDKIEEIILEGMFSVSLKSFGLIFEENLKGLKRINLKGTLFKKEEIEEFSKKTQCEIKSDFGIIQSSGKK
jgi:hypothetical protein